MVRTGHGSGNKKKSWPGPAGTGWSTRPRFRRAISHPFTRGRSKTRPLACFRGISSMNRCIAGFGATLILAAFSTAVNAMMPCIFCGDVREEICRNCHEDLEGLPMLRTTNPNRHHLLVGTPIPSLSRSKAPDAPGGTPGEPYHCLACHSLTRGATGNIDIQPFRDCLLCHPVWRVTGSPMRGTNVHHETETFRQHKCWTCHSRTGGLPPEDGATTGGGGGMGGGGMGGRGGRM